ncbi:MAG: thioredoxin family protein [Anaerolineae bacterium]|nr:thioredoxin family protein [Anaerolineae bacterium]
MIERLLIVLAFAALLTLGFRLLRRGQLARAVRIAPADPLLAALRPGVPAILYFTTPACAPCRTRQRPAIQRLLAELGDRVQVIEVNAAEQLDAARRWGVLSVPTTFVLDGEGRPRAMNTGVAGLETLRGQLRQL